MPHTASQAACNHLPATAQAAPSRARPGGRPGRTGSVPARAGADPLSCLMLAAILGLYGAGKAEAQEGKADAGAARIEEVVVTASRIARSGFTAPTPVTSVTAEDLAASGAPDIAGYLNDLPAFRATATPTNTGLSTSGAGGNFVDLRGLGPRRTLVLVNGRRHVPTTSEGTVDLNVVPAVAVQRIEVVTGGASAAWGSDAVAGVVNILYDTTLKGGRVEAQHGLSEHGDADDTRVSAAFGDDLFGGRGHVLLAADYHRNKGILAQSDRDWGARRWQRITNPQDRGPNDGQPATIIRPDVTLAIMTEGGVTLGPPAVANIEYGPNGEPRPFQRGDVISPPYMVGGSGANFGHGAVLAVPFERRNLTAAFHYDVLPDVTFFFEGAATEADTRAPIVPSFTTGLSIAADNAYLPPSLAQTLRANNLPSVAIGRFNRDMGAIIAERRSQVHRAVAGLEGRIADSWSWEGFYQHGSTTFLNKQSNNLIAANFALAADAVRDPATGRIVCRAALNPQALPAALRPAAQACVPLNLFGAGSPSPEAIAYVHGTALLDQEIGQDVFAAQVDGDIMTLPAGAVAVALGAEHRRETLDARADAVSQAGGFSISNPQSLSGRITVSEYFAEAIVPVLADLPLARSVELNGAIRWTDYSTTGRALTWKLGSVWVPADDLLLRGTLSRDIRAPNIQELFTTGIVGFFSPRDPCDATRQALNPAFAAGCRAAGLAADFVAAAGVARQPQSGNLDLDEERAETRSVGAVFTPGLVPGLQASVDWYDIDVQRAISLLSGQTILERCYGQGFPNASCAFVTRSETGQLTEIRSTYLNSAASRTKGVDFEVDYRFEAAQVGLGDQDTVDLRLLGSYVYEKSESPDSVTRFERAGEVGADSTNRGVPKWRWNGRVGYLTDWFGTTASVRYIGPGKLSNTLTAEEIEDNHVGAQWYVDVSARASTNLGPYTVELFGGVNNLFDNGPPVVPTDFIQSFATNTGLYDVVGRYYYAGVRARF